MDIGIAFENEELSDSRETSPYEKHKWRDGTTKEKGDYSLVVTGLDVDNDEEDPNNDKVVVTGEDDDNENVEPSWWNRTFMPDAELHFGGSKVVEVAGVKFFKFLAWTVVSLVLIHYLIQLLDWERDEDYSLENMILFDANLIVLDVMVFFCVGRLFHQHGVDNLAWLLTTTVSAIYSSWAKRFEFLQHSLSLFEIHCRWPWKLWVFVAFMVPLFVSVVWCHVRHAARGQDRFGLKQKVVEFLLTLLIFVIPYASHPNFHLHHWYAFWLLGMHANFDTWWSRATMAWCWGQYINGIAVYGRDPILTCATSFYFSTNQRCPFMECALLEQDDDSILAHHEYKPMVTPDWRNCTGYIP